MDIITDGRRFTYEQWEAFIKSEEMKMTTTVKVHVNGNYIAKVEGTLANGQHIVDEVVGTSEKSYSLAHPADGTFRITERQMTPEEIAKRDGPVD